MRFANRHFVPFYRAAGQLSLADQRELVRAVIKREGGKPVHVEYDASTLVGARDEWVKNMRKTEVAIVWALWQVAEPGKSSVRPVTDQTQAVEALQAASFAVIEATTGITSLDGEKWRARKAECIDYIAAGKRRHAPRTQVEVKKARKRAAPGTVARWLDPANKVIFDRWDTHWKSMKYKTTVDAWNALPQKIRNELGTMRTAAEIFKSRHAGDPRKGGRPRKTKPAQKRKT